MRLHLICSLLTVRSIWISGINSLIVVSFNQVWLNKTNNSAILIYLPKLLCFFWLKNAFFWIAPKNNTAQFTVQMLWSDIPKLLLRLQVVSTSCHFDAKVPHKKVVKLMKFGIPLKTRPNKKLSLKKYSIDSILE